MILILTCILSGAIGGMGIGGGVVLIPVLTAFFNIGQKEAQFINLIYFVPVALCALIVHKKAGNLEIKKAVFMAVGGVLGAIAGSNLAAYIGINILKRLFGFFLLAVGISQFKKQ